MEGTIMTSKALVLGVVALCALPAAGQAQVLLSENFDELTPGTVPNGASVGPDFTGTNVVIVGPANNHGSCRAPASGHCLALNDMLGSLVSVPVTLLPGHTYDLSFDLQGNSLRPNTTSSMVTVTLGSFFDRPFTLTNGSPTDSVSVIDPITVPTSMSRVSVVLAFNGTGSANITDGTVIDNILLAQTSVPEPATLGLLVLGLLGAGLAGRKRRN
jgi:hypothetical protein